MCPFSTDQTLRDASCAEWLKDAGKGHGEESIEARKGNFLSSVTSNCFFNSYLMQDSTASHDRTEIPTKNETPPIPDVLRAEIEVVKMFKAGDFALMYAALAKYKAAGVSVPITLLTEMASALNEALPSDQTREDLHQCKIEVPKFYAEKEIRLYPLAAAAASHVEYLHQLFALYELDNMEAPKFLESYLWLCYHTKDLHTIQRLVHKYLNKELYDSRTLSHITNAFIYNYDVEFAKNLFSSIIGIQKPLDEAYLYTTLVAFSQVKASYDNIIQIFKKWSVSSNCEGPNPKTIAFLLKLSYMHGNSAEVAAINEIVDRLGYDGNFFVQMVKAQAKIINRDNNRVKNISSQDWQEFLQIRSGLLGSSDALNALYELYLHFFCTYSTMEAVEKILREMNRDGMRLTRFAYESIAAHFVAARKFGTLFKFIRKFLSQTISFEPVYAKYIFDGFVRTHPYHGEEFALRMSAWLSENLQPEMDRRLQACCRLKKLASSVSPTAVLTSDLSTLKYDSSTWKKIRYDPNKPAMKLQRRLQMSYRAELGLQAILRKGISPDYSVIEETLRNLGPTIREGILNALPALRMTKHSLRLRIYDFILRKPDKYEFAEFVAKMEPHLNTSDRILLARRALNNCSYLICSSLLKGVNPLELTDSRHMIVLNLKLRNSVQSNDLQAFNESISLFPLHLITLSPFLLKQSRFVEKMLQKKMKATANDNEQISASLQRLRGLIGDIEVRLQKDETDIEAIMNDVFDVLSAWVRKSKVPQN